MSTITFEDFRGQGAEIQALRRQISEKRMVHALLIIGDPGTGKKTLANLFAAALMCTSDQDAPCGRCEGCRTALAGEHPDVTVIEKGVPLSADTARGRATIPVDDIREMIRLCSRYAFESGNRAVLIRDAENLTVQAQNSLLKILEEPPENTYFFLTSSHPELLLTTVRSRCRPLKLVPWETSRIEKVLISQGTDPEKAGKAAAAAEGSIGTAIRLASDDGYWKLCEEVMNAFFRNRKRSDILAISTAWKDRKAEADMIFSILEGDMHRLLQYRLRPDGKDKLNDFPAEWHRFAASAPLDRFTMLNDRISEARKQTVFNVNFQAVIEQLLLVFIGESDQWVK